MTRRARHTQATIRRAIRAARAEGVRRIVIDGIEFDIFPKNESQEPSRDKPAPLEQEREFRL